MAILVSCLLVVKIKADYFFIFIASTTVFLLSFLILNLPSKNGQVNAVPQKNIPELTGILSNNEDIRLKATRALAERVGTEEALEIVKNSGLPATGESHLAVHQIGFQAYKVYGKEAIRHCKDYFLYACYHGAIIEAATDQGVEVITQMTDTCKDSPSRYFQCVHAAGHAINAIHNYDLPNALKTCDQFYEKEKSFPDTLTSCHNGAFMENIFGVHDWGTGNIAKRDWLSNDPFFPCSAFGEKYQKGCWLNQAARIYTLKGANLTKTAETCKQVKNNQHRSWCMNNVARQIHPLTYGSIDKVFELCKLVGDDWETECINVNAISYASVGDPALAGQICKALLEAKQRDCNRGIGGF